jgi:AmmeMemoRadiSam system protein A/AmmeMemoRadiSam system protein B
MKTSLEPIKPGNKTAAVGVDAVLCAVLMPHAPILVPPVGGSRGEAAADTCRAMREVAGKIVSLHPESLVLVSPHSPRRSGAFGLWSGDVLEGSFEPFGAPQVRVKLPNDRRLVSAIIAGSKARNVVTWSIPSQPLDHGALVPLWFLAEAGWTGPTVIASLNYPDEGGLTSFGEAIAAAAKSLHRRIALVASGDMSHRLTQGAPCGFHPDAHRTDETFIRLIRAGDYRGLQRMDPELRELAAEDAVDSTIIAAAAVDWSAVGHKVLNYEGPFGVGYGVAVLFAPEMPVPSAKEAGCPGNVLPGIARRSVETALRNISEKAPPAAGEYLGAARGVFVTIRHRQGKLRGCIGTIAPACANLVEETWRNARLAALHDGRFESVGLGELPQLRFEVSVLHPPEDVASADELDPRRYGVIVSTPDGRRGLLLPGIEEITTVEQQLLFARQKGRIDPDEPAQLQRFEVDHFGET